MRIRIMSGYYVVDGPILATMIQDNRQDFITTATFEHMLNRKLRPSNVDPEEKYGNAINDAHLACGCSDIQVEVAHPGDDGMEGTECGYIYVIASINELRKNCNSHVAFLSLILPDEHKYNYVDMTINLRQLGYGIEIDGVDMDQEIAFLVAMPSENGVDVPDYIPLKFLQHLAYE